MTIKVFFQKHKKKKILPKVLNGSVCVYACVLYDTLHLWPSPTGWQLAVPQYLPFLFSYYIHVLLLVLSPILPPTPPFYFIPVFLNHFCYLHSFLPLTLWPLSLFSFLLPSFFQTLSSSIFFCAASVQIYQQTTNVNDVNKRWLISWLLSVNHIWSDQ